MMRQKTWQITKGSEKMTCLRKQDRWHGPVPSLLFALLNVPAADDGGNDVFFHVSAMREGDDVTEGTAVTFEKDIDEKSGKPKAISVDLM